MKNKTIIIKIKKASGLSEESIKLNISTYINMGISKDETEALLHILRLLTGTKAVK